MSRTIFITGASTGLGRATAQLFAGRGWKVIATMRKPADGDELARTPGVTVLPLDVTDRESFATFLDKARTDGGGHIDVLINNAGVMPVGPFLEQSEQSIRSSIEVNLYGVIAGCQLALPDMIARGRGHIINIASLSGLIPVPGQVVYVGAKFGVVGLTAALADEGVRAAYASRYEAWRAQFNSRDDGRAAERVVARILDQGFVTR